MTNEKLDGLSMNIEKEARERLHSVFPECFSEGQLDIDKLLTMCGEYITNDFEKYKFEWNGKGDAMKLGQRRSAACLRPCIEESVNFDTTQNLYIEGDNLEVLKLLQTAYFRQVKMIYIDPPYNTGHDFVYEDDFTDPLERYLEVTSQATKSNPETMGRFHTAWLNMMYPRLRLAANLLRDDGVIFISIDDNEQANMRKLCDEVFGEENFVANIMWQKRYSPANDHKSICPIHDFIIVYQKSSSWHRNLLARSEQNDSQYRYEDEKGIFRPDNYKCNKTADERPNLYYAITNPNTGEEIWPSRDAVWRYSKERHEENVANDMVFWGKDGTGKTPAFKRYRHMLRGGGGIVPGTWWTYDFAGHNDEAAKEVSELIGSRVFSSPKPVKLITKLLQLATNPSDGDLILDFFSGSGVTAHAVMQLNKEDGGNRRFICVQLPELCDEKSEAYKAGYKNICEIGKERIRRAGAKLLETDGQLKLGDDRPPLDIGFKVFKLDSSNIKFWDGIPVRVGDGQLYFDKVRNVIDGVKDDRPPLDVVYELMLKLGVPLTVPVEIKEIQGKSVYSVDGDLLLFCLDKNITAEFIEALADLAPAKIIVAEMGFADDTAMANAHYILKDRGIEIKLV